MLLGKSTHLRDSMVFLMKMNAGVLLLYSIDLDTHS